MADQIRKARVDEIREIQKMLAGHAQRGDMLPRSLSELYDNLRDIFVYLDDDKPEIIGTCSMHICWEDLAEIRSLAVREPYQGQGIGKKLVEACIAEASRFGIAPHLRSHVPGRVFSKNRVPSSGQGDVAPQNLGRLPKVHQISRVR